MRNQGYAAKVCSPDPILPFPCAEDQLQQEHGSSTMFL